MSNDDDDIQGAKTFSSYLSLREEWEAAGREPVLMLFRIREFLEKEMGDFKAYKVPVVADVLICSGPHEGDVWPMQRFFGAPTNALRGVKNPKKDEEPLPPTTKVGDKIAARVIHVERRGSQPFDGLDTPSAVELAQIRKVHNGGAGWDGPLGADRRANGEPVAGGGADDDLVSAGVGGKRPF